MEVFSSAINYADGKGFLMFLEFKINNGVTNANLKRPCCKRGRGGNMHAAKDHYSLSEMQIHTNSIKCRRIANPAERGYRKFSTPNEHLQYKSIPSQVCTTLATILVRTN